MLKPITIGIVLATILIFFLNSMMNSALAADTNTVSSTVVTDKSVPTASAPSVVVNNSDICKVATSGAIQTNILGLATGIVVDDELCQLLKLSRQLYASGLKVASISLLATDPRVFDSMWASGTFPPINSAIGLDAKTEWENNPNLIPDGSMVKANLLKEEIVIIKEVKEGRHNDIKKYVFSGIALLLLL